jgi:menaquinone-dependent protoporphyrinogen IX oxidase
MTVRLVVSPFAASGINLIISYENRRSYMRKTGNAFGLAEGLKITILFFVASLCISGIANPVASGDSNPVVKKVLVTYDSKHGSTEDIAEGIGNILQEKGFQVDVEKAYMVDEISQYEAIVLGSPIYYNVFLPGTMQFLEKHKNLLAEKKVAVFAISTSVNPDTGHVNEHVRTIAVRELEKFPGIEPIGTIGLLPGKYFFKEVFPVELIALKKFFGEAGDLTNDAIVRNWTEEIAVLF